MADKVNKKQPKQKPAKDNGEGKKRQDKTLDQLVEEHGGEDAPEKMREQHGDQ